MTVQYIDQQGRLRVPAHIRNALNLTAGRVVEVTMEDGAVRITPTQERCAICGKALEDAPRITITTGSNQKHVCGDCSRQIREAE